MLFYFTSLCLAYKFMIHAWLAKNVLNKKIECLVQHLATFREDQDYVLFCL